MDQNFEQTIPLPWIIAGFLLLLIASKVAQKKLRQRKLRHEGQLFANGGEPLPIEQRVAANPDWSSGEIRSKGRVAVVILWTLALTWNLTFGVSFIKSLSNPAMTTGARIVLGVFALLGIVPIVFATHFTMRQFRFGKSRCRIQGKAGVLGKKMEGSIFTKFDIPATGEYLVELQCLEHYSSGSGKNRRTESRVQWHGKHTVSHQGKKSTLGIPFAFEIPTYPPETGDQTSRGTVSWQLTIKAPVKGIDYSALFIVPVFKVE